MKQVVTGAQGALRVYQQLRDGGGRWTGVIVSLDSKLKYAAPIEFGRTANGRWVRRAGPALYMHAGLEAATRQASNELPHALQQGPSEVDGLKRALNRTALTVAEQKVPVRSGKLKASLRSVPRDGQ